MCANTKLNHAGRSLVIRFKLITRLKPIIRFNLIIKLKLTMRFRLIITFHTTLTVKRMLEADLPTPTWKMNSQKRTPITEMSASTVK